MVRVQKGKEIWDDCISEGKMSVAQQKVAEGQLKEREGES